MSSVVSSTVVAGTVSVLAILGAGAVVVSRYTPTTDAAQSPTPDPPPQADTQPQQTANLPSSAPIAPASPAQSPPPPSPPPPTPPPPPPPPPPLNPPWVAAPMPPGVSIAIDEVTSKDEAEAESIWPTFCVEREVVNPGGAIQFGDCLQHVRLRPSDASSWMVFAFVQYDKMSLANDIAVEWDARYKSVSAHYTTRSDGTRDHVPAHEGDIKTAMDAISRGSAYLSLNKTPPAGQEQVQFLLNMFPDDHDGIPELIGCDSNPRQGGLVHWTTKGAQMIDVDLPCFNYVVSELQLPAITINDGQPFLDLVQSIVQSSVQSRLLGLRNVQRRVLTEMKNDARLSQLFQPVLSRGGLPPGKTLLAHLLRELLTKLGRTEAVHGELLNFDFGGNPHIIIHACIWSLNRVNPNAARAYSREAIANQIWDDIGLGSGQRRPKWLSRSDFDRVVSMLADIRDPQLNGATAKAYGDFASARSSLYTPMQQTQCTVDNFTLSVVRAVSDPSVGNQISTDDAWKRCMHLSYGEENPVAGFDPAIDLRVL